MDERKAHVSELLESYASLGPNATSASPPELISCREARELVDLALANANFRLLVGRRRLLAGSSGQSEYDKGAEQVRAALEGAELLLVPKKSDEEEAPKKGKNTAESIAAAIMQTTDATKRAKLIREREAAARAAKDAAESAQTIVPVTDICLNARSSAVVEILRAIATASGPPQPSAPQIQNVAIVRERYNSSRPDPLRWYD
jgi:hypothetical protein